MSKVMRRAFLWNVGGYAIQILSLLAQVIIVSRILNPAEVGVFGASRGILAIIKAIPNSGAIYTLASFPRLRTIHFRMMSGLMSLAGAAQVVVVLLGCLAAWKIQGPTSMVIALATLSLTCLIEGQQLTSEALLMRRLDYRPIIIADGLSFVTSIAVILLLHKNIPSFHLLTVSAYVEASVRLIALKLPTWRETFLQWPRYRLLKGAWAHSLKLMTANLFYIISSNGDRALVGGLLGDGSAGFYWRGQQLINAPVTAYGRVVNKVLMPAAANSKTAGVSLEWVIDLALNTSIRMGLFAGVGLWVLGRPVIEVVLGKSWVETAIVLQITGLLIVFRFMYKALDSIIVGQLLAKASIIGSAILASSTICFLAIGARYGLQGACWGISSAQFVTSAYYLWAMPHHKLTTFSHIAKTAGVALAEAAVLAVPVFTLWWWLESIQANSWIKIAALGALMAAWGALVFLKVKAARKKVRTTVEEEPLEPLSHLDE